MFQIVTSSGTIIFAITIAATPGKIGVAGEHLTDRAITTQPFTSHFQRG